MRTIEEITGNKKLMGLKYDVDPVNRERFSGSGYIVFNPKRISEAAKVIFGSNENGWEHVSVSFPRRCPTWDEMCAAKDIFWQAEECCVEYHPPKSEYINIHDYCLHIWRPKNGQIAQPDADLVI